MPLGTLYPPALLDETLVIARRCTFDLGQLRYHYPRELVPAGHDAGSWLRAVTEEGIALRWPHGIGAKTMQQIDHELALISELGYQSYFLTVHDIVRFARSRSILCQGRGSAANSAVCFALEHARSTRALRICSLSASCRGARRATGYRRGFRARTPRRRCSSTCSSATAAPARR